MECLDMKNNSSSKRTIYYQRSDDSSDNNFNHIIFLYHAISKPDSGNG